jgi:hypothetical protein
MVKAGWLFCSSGTDADFFTRSCSAVNRLGQREAGQHVTKPLHPCVIRKFQTAGKSITSPEIKFRQLQ